MPRCWRPSFGVSSRCGSSPTTSTMPILPGAPHISAPASGLASVSFVRSAAASPGCASRLMSSIFQAGTGRCRLLPARFRPKRKQASGTSKTEPGCSTLTLPIRRAEDPAVTEPGDPVMIVVGGGAIALSTTQELCALQGHRVVVLWRRDPDFTRAVEGIGAVHIAAARPDSTEALDRAGVRHALTILALSPDDQLNLHAALLARDANPRIRIVLRQFNRTLAHKIEQNLPDTAVLSLAWHSAASYAATALDPSCFRGLQFPEPDGPLTGFVERIAAEEDFVGRSIAEVEAALSARVVAVNGDTTIDRQARIPWRARVCLYGTIDQLMKSAPQREAGKEHSSDAVMLPRRPRRFG